MRTLVMLQAGHTTVVKRTPHEIYEAYCECKKKKHTLLCVKDENYIDVASIVAFVAVADKG